MYKKILSIILFGAMAACGDNTEKRELEKWSFSLEKDGTAGEKRAVAHSPKAFPESAPSLPYTDISSKLWVGCEKGRYWTYIYYSKSNWVASWVKSKFYDSGRQYSIRRKVESLAESVTVNSQNHDGNLLFFRHKEKENLALWMYNPSIIYDSPDLHENGKLVFEYSLTGASGAINEIFQHCGVKAAAAAAAAAGEAFSVPKD